MDLGTTLRTARERRQLPLTGLAVKTKIPVKLLAALEQNDFDKVPSGIFVRGYLRAYAREVGLDPDQVIEQYLAESGAAAPAAAEAPVLRKADEAIDEARVDPNLSESGPGWAYALIVAALLVAVISFNRSDSSDEPAPAPAPLLEHAAAQADAPHATPSEDLHAVATAGAGLRFEMQAQGLCWVEAVVDGKKVVYRLMQPGERQTIEPEREIVLRIGDPGALTYTVNGKPGEPLGKPGVPVTVRFTSESGRIALAS